MPITAPLASTGTPEGDLLNAIVCALARWGMVVRKLI